MKGVQMGQLKGIVRCVRQAHRWSTRESIERRGSLKLDVLGINNTMLQGYLSLNSCLTSINQSCFSNFVLCIRRKFPPSSILHKTKLLFRVSCLSLQTIFGQLKFCWLNLTVWFCLLVRAFAFFSWVRRRVLFVVILHMNAIWLSRNSAGEPKVRTCMQTKPNG